MLTFCSLFLQPIIPKILPAKSAHPYYSVNGSWVRDNTKPADMSMKNKRMDQRYIPTPPPLSGSSQPHQGVLLYSVSSILLTCAEYHKEQSKHEILVNARNEEIS